LKLVENGGFQVGRATKKTRNRRIFEMWMACYTLEKIAELLAILPKHLILYTAHAIDFKPLIFER